MPGQKFMDINEFLELYFRAKQTDPAKPGTRGAGQGFFGFVLNALSKHFSIPERIREIKERWENPEYKKPTEDVKKLYFEWFRALENPGVESSRFLEMVRNIAAFESAMDYREHHESWPWDQLHDETKWLLGIIDRGEIKDPEIKRILLKRIIATRSYDDTNHYKILRDIMFLPGATLYDFYQYMLGIRYELSIRKNKNGFITQKTIDEIEQFFTNWENILDQELRVELRSPLPRISEVKRSEIRAFMDVYNLYDQQVTEYLDNDEARNRAHQNVHRLYRKYNFDSMMEFGANPESDYLQYFEDQAAESSLLHDLVERRKDLLNQISEIHINSETALQNADNLAQGTIKLKDEIIDITYEKRYTETVNKDLTNLVTKFINAVNVSAEQSGLLNKGDNIAREINDLPNQLAKMDEEHKKLEVFFKRQAVHDKEEAKRERVKSGQKPFKPSPQPKEPDYFTPDGEQPSAKMVRLQERCMVLEKELGEYSHTEEDSRETRKLEDEENFNSTVARNKLRMETDKLKTRNDFMRGTLKAFLQLATERINGYALHKGRDLENMVIKLQNDLQEKRQ